MDNIMEEKTVWLMMTNSECHEVYETYELAEKAMRRYVTGWVRRMGKGSTYDYITPKSAVCYGPVTDGGHSSVMSVSITRRILRGKLSTRQNRTLD